MSIIPRMLLTLWHSFITRIITSPGGHQPPCYWSLAKATPFDHNTSSMGFPDQGAYVRCLVILCIRRRSVSSGHEAAYLRLVVLTFMAGSPLIRAYYACQAMIASYDGWYTQGKRSDHASRCQSHLLSSSLHHQELDQGMISIALADAWPKLTTCQLCTTVSSFHGAVHWLQSTHGDRMLIRVDLQAGLQQEAASL